MKHAKKNQNKAFAIPVSVALALSLSMGAMTVSHADAKSLFNPKSWFSSTQAADQAADAAVSDARKKAEEAQKAANQAMQDAQKALEKAEEARRQAEELEKTPSTSKKHLVVTPPATQENTATESTSANQTEAKTDRVYQAPESSEPKAFETKTTEKTLATSGKREAWNPMTWFHKENEDASTGLDGSLSNEKADKSTPEAETAKKQVESQKTDTASTTIGEDASTQASSTQTKGSWSLKNMFTKPTPVEGQTASTEAATPSGSDSKSQPTDETRKASTQGKSGGWNFLNILSHPGQQAEAPDAKDASESNKSEQPDNASDEQAVKTKAVLIETEKGNIAFELYPDQAPQTVANFVKLVNEGFYNRYNMKFHRVVPGFVIQTGDPTGTGAGGSKQRVPLEAKNKLSHNARGIVAMARGADPDSATSQFYITLAPQTTLDGKYAIFGRVISGLDVLSKIEKDDMLYGIRIVDMSSIVRDQPTDKKKFFSFAK